MEFEKQIYKQIYKMSKRKIILTKEQQQAYNLMVQGKNIFFNRSCREWKNSSY